MRNETIRFVTFALTIGIGLVFVASGLTLLNAGTDVDPAYTQAGILLLPGGLLTIAVAIRWQLPVLLNRIILRRTARLLLVALATVVLLSWGAFSQIRSDAVGGLAGLLFGLGFLAVFLRMVTHSRRSLSPEKFESLKREMQRASLRPLGVTILAALMAADGVLSILVAIVLGLVGVGHPRDFFWLLPTILPLIVAGFLKTPLSFGLSNGAGWSWTVAVLYSSFYLALWGGVGPLTLFVWPSLSHFLTLSLGLIIFLPYPLMILSVIVSNALSMWTLYYLNTRGVRGFFGRASGEGTVLRARISVP